MSTKLSARVIEIMAGEGREIRFFVRSVSAGCRILTCAVERDAWAAYREHDVFVEVNEDLEERPGASPIGAAL